MTKLAHVAKLTHLAKFAHFTKSTKFAQFANLTKDIFCVLQYRLATSIRALPFVLPY
jgi:hypothetical protein